MTVKTETFHLSRSDSAVTETDGTASAWSDIWDYQVPTGVAHVLKPEHQFSAYLEDASAEVGSGTCRLRIEVRDQTESDRRVVFGPVQYVRIKEFQDKRKVAVLNVPAPVPVKERSHIVVVVYDDGAIDASDSYFDLEMERVREAL